MSAPREKCPKCGELVKAVYSNYEREWSFACRDCGYVWERDWKPSDAGKRGTPEGGSRE